MYLHFMRIKLVTKLRYICSSDIRFYSIIGIREMGTCVSFIGVGCCLGEGSILIIRILPSPVVLGIHGRVILAVRATFSSRRFVCLLGRSRCCRRPIRYAFSR